MRRIAVFHARALPAPSRSPSAILLTPGAAHARVVERVAAVVGDALVLASEVEDRVGPLMADVNRITDPDKRSARATALRREVLERLIDDELI